MQVFLAHGPLGASVVALAFACWKLIESNKEIQAQRVEDARGVTSVVLALVDKHNEALDKNTRALEDLARERRQS